MEGTVEEDKGARIRNGIKSINKLGACFEKTWPYDIIQFTERPSKEAYMEAKAHRALKYHRVDQTEQSLKQAINTGFPVIFGFVVYNSINKETVTRSGIIPIPMSKDAQIGGHCVLLCGWNDSQRLFQIQNSWGENWGVQGFGYMSYDYLLNPELADDFWLVTFVK